MPARNFQHRLPRGKNQEDEAEYEREVDAAMRRLAQEAEAGGVVVEARQHDEQRADDEGRRRHERPEPHLGIVFLLELGRFRGVDFLHAAISQDPAQATLLPPHKASGAGWPAPPVRDRVARRLVRAYFSMPFSL
jgi:hypothetical protein